MIRWDTTTTGKGGAQMRKEITVAGSAPVGGMSNDEPPDVRFKMDDTDPDLVTIEQGGSMVFIKFAALKAAFEAL